MQQVVFKNSSETWLSCGFYIAPNTLLSPLIPILNPVVFGSPVTLLKQSVRHGYTIWHTDTPYNGNIKLCQMVNFNSGDKALLLESNMGLTLEGWVWDQKYGTYTIKSFDDLSSPLHSGRGVVNERGEIIGIVKADDSYNKSMYIIPIDVISEKEGFAIVKGDLCFKYVDRNISELIKDGSQVLINDFYFRDGDIKLERGEEVAVTDVDGNAYHITGTKNGVIVGVSLSPVVTFTDYMFQSREGKTYCLDRLSPIMNLLVVKAEDAYIMMEFTQFAEKVKKQGEIGGSIELEWSDGYTETVPVVDYKHYFF